MSAAEHSKFIHDASASEVHVYCAHSRGVEKNRTVVAELEITVYINAGYIQKNRASWTTRLARSRSPTIK